VSTVLCLSFSLYFEEGDAAAMAVTAALVGQGPGTCGFKQETCGINQAGEN